jgi:hypothetical protein
MSQQVGKQYREASQVSCWPAGTQVNLSDSGACAGCQPLLPSRHRLSHPPSPSPYFQQASHLHSSRQVTATTTGLSATATWGTGVLTSSVPGTEHV